MRNAKHAICLRISALLAILLMGVLPATHAAERITYYHTDALGSPTAATDQQGNIVWRETYEPYGARIKKEPAASTNARWHTGHVLDAETGLQYAGARYYDPVLGRFMGIDPKGFSQGNPRSFNRFAYGNNNPYKYVDPDGQAAVLALIPPVIIGGIIYYAATPDQRAQMGSAVTQMGQNLTGNMQALGDKVGSLTRPMFNESSGGNSTTVAGEPPASAPVGNRGDGGEIKIQPGTNAPTTIGGREYTGHALDRMQGRGQTPSVVENTVQTGKPSPGREPGTTRHHDPSNGTTVITGSGGRVITVY